MTPSTKHAQWWMTAGDPGGIGPELVARLALEGELHDTVVVAHPEVWARGFAALGATAPTPAVVDSAEAALSLKAAQPHTHVLWNPSATHWPADAGHPLALQQAAQHPWAQAPWGQVQALQGAEALRTLHAAIQALGQGRGLGLVTAPIHKEALALAGSPFPGHTEMLQAWSQPPAPEVRMMLANDELKVVLVTIHQALRQALDAVTLPAVLSTVRITHAALQGLGWARPRIAVAGLNPHAGEGGRFGREEIDTIGPAIEAARREGIDARGPYPPDTVFMRARHTPQRPGEFDVVVAMTHDHGLIPVKYLGVEQGVNITLGLPFVRTSPDHGTAFDIAGTGRADPSSLRAALHQARALASRRTRN